MTAVSRSRPACKTRPSRAALPVLLLALAGAIGGCGHTGASATAQGAADSGTSTQADTAQSVQSSAATGAAAAAGDPQLTALTADDIKFYLDVMGAAAERVRHPTPQDLDALSKQKAFIDASSASAQTNAAQEQAISDDTAKAQAAIAAAMQSGDTAKARALADAERTRLQAQAAALHPAAMPDPATMHLAVNLGDGQADRQIVAERHLDSQRYERVASVIEEILVPPGTPMADCGGSDCGNAPSAAEVQRQRAHEAGVARNRKLLMPYAVQIRPLQQTVRNGKE